MELSSNFFYIWGTGVHLKRNTCLVIYNKGSLVFKFYYIETIDNSDEFSFGHVWRLNMPEVSALIFLDCLSNDRGYLNPNSWFSSNLAGSNRI